MKATVVIPNYNGIEYLDDCLKSLYRGTVVPEIIVVDNGSADGSLEAIRAGYPEVRVISFRENTGFSHAVNAGIREAVTEYVILLNNDTVVEQHFVERLIRAMEKKPFVFSAGAKMLSLKEPEMIDDAGDLYCCLGWAFALGKGQRKDAYAKRARVFAACAGAAIYRKSVLEQLGGFDDNFFAYLEDIDVGYRAKAEGYDNLFIPEAVVYHAGSAVSGSRYNEFKVKLTARNSVYLIYKNMPFLQILLNSPFLLAGFMVKWLFFLKKGLGGVYAKGLVDGVILCSSTKGKKQKTPFLSENFGNYCRIQGELWINLLRRILG